MLLSAALNSGLDVEAATTTGSVMASFDRVEEVGLGSTFVKTSKFAGMTRPGLAAIAEATASVPISGLDSLMTVVSRVESEDAGVEDVVVVVGSLVATTDFSTKSDSSI